ncbi:MAG: hypothetical protein ASUL_03959 [Candidatus Aramenus sulfurataquae]|jgi:hypothetical protein|uniref:Uncharacterized protein n=3 Tax=Candidatus Aramenus sulfurataquae TaxID=1326980 RepID=W7KY52_9CREN|nr:MAG: hypothetical protein ASUL_03959 [Candidatus Aramenus sulfurataquae]
MKIFKYFWLYIYSMSESLLKPGTTPWEIVVGYFVVAAAVAGLILWKARPKFTTLDLVYVAIGGAMTAVADHVVGDAIFLPSPIYPLVNPPVWFRIIVFFITVGLVRKVGAGMFGMAVFDLVGDLLHFGFGGEPLWLFEDVLTYGFMVDLTIFLTKGKIFGIGSKGSNYAMALIEGLLLGFAFTFVHPFFTYGFFAPLIFGFVPDQARILYLFISYLPGDLIIGAISGVISLRVAKTVAI